MNRELVANQSGSERAPERATASLTLRAYQVGFPPLRLVPAPREREWMDATSERFAYRCLPLDMANQAGWWLLNSHSLTVIWNGRADHDALKLSWGSGEPPFPAVSHFGHGILTWHIPYLFRTPPGWNLLVRGPANLPKAGVTPLEGLVETDWAVATFTMNWQLTTVGQPVIFAVDEPICQLVPQRRWELEAFSPELCDLEAAPELAAAYHAWDVSRTQFSQELKVPDSAAWRRGWQKDYFHGGAPDGTTAPEHQTKLRLRPFAEPAEICPAEEIRKGRSRTHQR